MENTDFLKKMISESLKLLDEGTNHSNEVSIVDVQDKPEVGKPGEYSLEDHIKMLKEEREFLIKKLQNM
jgi:hypothetical protein